MKAVTTVGFTTRFMGNMARAPREPSLQSATARAALRARPEPYWAKVASGLFVGYRKTPKASAWIARTYAAGRYQEQRIGTPDDTLRADNAVVFTYFQAVERARQIGQGLANPAPKHYGDGPTLNDCWTFYRNQHLTTKRSRKVAEAFWALHVEQDIGKRLVASLTATDFQTWLRGVASKPPRARGKERVVDLSDPAVLAARHATANRVWTIVKAALNFCVKRDDSPLQTDRMPWRNVDPLPTSATSDEPPRMLDRGEITRLLNAAAPDLRDLLTAALMTGARYGELCALKVRDYDEESQRLTIRQTKSGKRLHQPLTPEGVTFFERITAGRDPDEVMLRKVDGTAWGVSHQSRPMRDAAQAAKVEDVSFKATRATYGKLLLLATKDIELVAKALGHSDSRITRKHYAQLLPSEVAQGIARMPSLGLNTDSKVKRMKRTRASG